VARTLLTLIAVLLAAAPAAASPVLDVGIADDRVLVHGTDAEASAAVAEWSALGVDVVRVHARWVAHVPEPNSPARPAGFDQRNPDDPRYNWDALDRAVGRVRGAGMRVLLTVTGSGPVWGTLEPGQGSQRYKPSPESFAEFASAVARRYGPHVDEYVIWNEPNHELWLQPQNSCTSRGCTPYAPHLYRRIVRAADPAIRAADPGARVMMGALAPRGTSARSRNARLRPLAFLRALGCVDSRYRRTRTGACRGFQPPSAYGFAYHPHGLKLAPSARSSHPDEAQLGDLSRLVSALDRVTRAGGLRSRHPSGRFPLWLDEYGYQTNPPDRIGVSLSRQASYLSQAEYIVWRNPAVRALSQYLLYDNGEPITKTFQTGLLFADGRAKPSYQAYKLPIWVPRRHVGNGARIRVWGMARPATNGRAPVVRIQFRRNGSRRYRTLATRQGSSLRGYLFARVHVPGPGRVRLRWQGQVSRSVMLFR
jgi:hypothetical protein